jgi:DNA-binding response OmpR family regulator
MKKKILIVEDDQFLRELYCEVLEKEGYSVSSGADGQEGYQLMKKGGFDLVLLDVMLPKMDGIDILKKLQKEKLIHKNKTIILLTNLSGEAVLRKKGRIEVDDYLIKSSLTPDALIAKVNYILKSGKDN